MAMQQMAWREMRYKSENLLRRLLQNLLARWGIRQWQMRMKGKECVFAINSWNDFCFNSLASSFGLYHLATGFQIDFHIFYLLASQLPFLMMYFFKKPLNYLAFIVRIKRINGCESILQSTTQMETIFITSKSIQSTKRKNHFPTCKLP